MARDTIVATTVTEAGIDLTGVDVAVNFADGNKVAYGKNRAVWILNGDSTTLTVTIPTPGTIGRGALAIADVTITVPAGAHRLAGPFGTEVKQADGTFWLNYTGADATVTVAAVDVIPAS